MHQPGSSTLSCARRTVALGMLLLNVCVPFQSTIHSSQWQCASCSVSLLIAAGHGDAHNGPLGAPQLARSLSIAFNCTVFQNPASRRSDDVVGVDSIFNPQRCVLNPRRHSSVVHVHGVVASGPHNNQSTATKARSTGGLAEIVVHRPGHVCSHLYLLRSAAYLLSVLPDVADVVDRSARSKVVPCSLYIRCISL